MSKKIKPKTKFNLQGLPTTGKSKPKSKPKSKITEFTAPVTLKADEVLAISGNVGKAIKPKPKPVKEITLATLHNFSAQQVFNYVARHLLEQSDKSVDVFTGKCKYKTAKGLKCAAGCLISEKEYSFYMEGKSWAGVAKTPEAYAYMGLITQLQYLHDDWPVHLWLERLKALALDFKLSTSQLAFYFWNAELCRYQHRSWREANFLHSSYKKGDKISMEEKTFEIIGKSRRPPPKNSYITYLVREISR